MLPGALDAYILWTEHGLSCRLSRNSDGWQVSLEADRGGPFLRRFAVSRGDANNHAEYLRVLLDRSRGGGGRHRHRQPLVLIVEDDADTLFAYQEILKLEGFRTASATSIGEARRLIRDARPAAILLDHVLPDGDGPMFARELRASGADAMIPIVLVTGLDPLTVAPAYDGRADAQLGKPCRPDTLTGVLKLLVQRTPAHASTRQAAPRPHGSLSRARCPVCGIGGALVDASGRFHCQQCGKEGTMDRARYVDTHS
jgi:CheY-like chemotaxis protein